MIDTLLIADIGATNGRFAIAKNGRLIEVKRYKCACFGLFEDMLDTFLHELTMPIPNQAVIAVATYVNDDKVSFTNLPWSFSIRELGQRYQFDYLKVINDFTAIAQATPTLTPEQLIPIGHEYAPIQDDKALAIIGPGTGLGVSGLLPHKGSWLPIQGQGGHVKYRPSDTFEAEMFTFLDKRFNYVSAEYLLSGRGLVLLYHTISQTRNQIPEFNEPDQIVNAAIQHNHEDALKTLEVFCKVLGSVAGDLVLTLGATGGCFIGGGVVNHMVDYFVNTNHFRSTFEDKGMMSDYMKAVPTYLISEKNAGLLGAIVSRDKAFDAIGIAYEDGNTQKIIA